MTPQQFKQKWGPGGPAFHLNEEQGAQSHFLDLCELLGVPKPGSEVGYLFEEKNAVVGGRTGYADVFRRGAFAWENKAPGKNLVAALRQLQTYSLALSNPPILVVCDRLTTRIYTQFNGHPTETHDVLLAELDQPEKLALLRRIWLDPESFRPKKTSRDITEAAAKSFATLAGQLRKSGHEPQKVSHFLTQCLFCFFAEDVGLLPDELFKKMINAKLDLQTRHGMLPSEKLTGGLTTLFTSMRTGDLFGVHDIVRFNGGLFKNIDVPKLDIMNVTELRNAADQNWSAIDVSIFGTLFERGLDPAKRSQLGAHYTDPATIMRIVEPVLQRPLLKIWEQVAHVIAGLMAKSSKKGDKNYKLALAEFVKWLDQLRDYRVLDPACGSGNFLFLGLKTLKDIEHKSHLDAVAMGLDREADLVTGPHNMLGIELNEYAAELARVTVWIGELQWRLTHGYEFKTNPVLEPLDHIECRDALLQFVPLAPHASPNKLPLPLGEGRGEGSPALDRSPSWDAQAGQRPAAHTLRFLKSPPASAPPALADLSAVRAEPVEAVWPKASVVIGNPPFLGAKKHWKELGVEYTEQLRAVYKGRIPPFSDLICYWFEKARQQTAEDLVGVVGLVATNSIRGGANRVVLERISADARIFGAWSDEPWVNEGAAVRVSLIAFGCKTYSEPAQLNGAIVKSINADLTSGSSVFEAKRLATNKGCCFFATIKAGSFEVEAKRARSWLQLPNVNGRSNSEVVKRWVNGLDIVRRMGDQWLVDFGCDMPESEASCFESPFSHVQLSVKPTRLLSNRESYRKFWWLFAEPIPKMRAATVGLSRQMVTVNVSKFRVFCWLSISVLPDHALSVIARADDTTFGILHSRFHELWSLRMGTSLEDRPRYTPTTCFETYPFPEGLTPADTAHKRTEAVSLNNAAGAGSPHPRPLPEGEGARGANVALIPAGLLAAPASTSASNVPPAQSARAGEAIKNIAVPTSLRAHAEAIARAAYRLNDLREAWLNPPEWTERVPEVIPLGMQTSPYPDRIVAKPGHEKDLADRTLTKLYNQRPAWLNAAHQTLDATVAAAYGWADYTADMPDEEILKRLLALNLARAGVNSSRAGGAPQHRTATGLATIPTK